jgi:TPR repeat protein
MKRTLPICLLFVLLGCSGEPESESKFPASVKVFSPNDPPPKKPAPKKLIEAPTSGPSSQETANNIERDKSKCEAGAAKDCVALGKDYWFAKDFVSSFAAYQKACDAKEQTGCYALAKSLILGLGASQDLKRAKEILDAACTQKNADACFSLADLIRHGRQTLFDAKKIQLLLEQSCDLKNADACYTLALRADRGREAPSDPTQAKIFFEEACTLKSGFACRKLSNYYAEGRLTQIDEAKAEELRTNAVLYHAEACQGGSPEDCIALGGLYMSGVGTKIDEPHANAAYQTGAGYYDAMCLAGSLDSCIEFAALLSRSGAWVLRDKKRSKELELMLAERLPAPCEAGDLESCYSLAVLFATGDGVDEDRDKAKKIFQNICDAGLQRGCSGVKRIDRKEKLLREAAGEE